MYTPASQLRKGLQGPLPLSYVRVECYKGTNYHKDILLRSGLRGFLNSLLFRSHCSILEDSISLGRPMLLEDVMIELDPCLDNVLEKNYYR